MQANPGQEARRHTAIMESSEAAAGASSIDDVIRIMRGLDASLPETDGVKWFNLARSNPYIQRVQFALAGMNAHINHDLPLAVVQTCADLAVFPSRDSPQFADFVAVNTILAAVEPAALQYLATGIVGLIAQELDPLGPVLSMWSIATARDTAWTNAELLRQVQELPILRARLMLVLDRMTGFAGRGLMVPIV